MSDDKNTNIKDKKVDQKFVRCISQSILAFTINIILGSYIVYVSKILHVIQLPTRIDQFPYNTQDVPDSITNRTIKDNVVGINYLYTEPPTPNDNSADTSIATDVAVLPSTTPVEMVFPMTRQLCYKQIYVNPHDYKQIYWPNYFLSGLYKSKRVSFLIIQLILQQMYSFIYNGICIFFEVVYGVNRDNDGWSIYLWETAMMILGPLLFVLFSFGWSVCLYFYTIYCIFMQIFTLYEYESASTGVRKDEPEYENHYADKEQDKRKNSWWWTGIPLIPIRGWLFWFSMLILLGFLYGFMLIGWILIPFVFIPFITVIFCYILNIETKIYNPSTFKAPDVVNVDPSYIYSICKNGYTFFYITSIISLINTMVFTTATTGTIVVAAFVLVIYIIYNMILKYIKPDNYSTITLLLSKVEPITYMFTYIFITCSSAYGNQVMTGVIILFLALWGLSNKHKMLYYPTKFNSAIYTLVPFATVPGNNLYNSGDNSTCGCYDNTVPYKDIDELLKKLQGTEYMQKLFRPSALTQEEKAQESSREESSKSGFKRALSFAGNIGIGSIKALSTLSGIPIFPEYFK